MNRSAFKRLVGVALLSLVATTPAFAQRMGSSNRNAPTVTQTIAFGTTTTIELSYTSITWAGGKWAKDLADEATKAGVRTGINDNAEKNPLGSLKTSVDIMLGTTKVAAGAYKLAFVLDDNYKWQILLINETGKLTIPLDLKNVQEEAKRLGVVLRAGEKDFTAELAVGFGTNRGVLTVSPVK